MVNRAFCLSLILTHNEVVMRMVVFAALCAGEFERVTYTRVHTTYPLEAEAMGTQLPVYTVSHYSTPEDLP